MRKRLHIFSDGSIAVSVEEQGHSAEVENSSLGKPVDIREASDEEVELIKKHGATKVKIKKGKLELRS